MAVGTGSSSPFEESYAELTELLGRERSRNEAGIAGLTELVRSLEIGVTFEEAGSSSRARVPAAEGERPAPVQYPLLPRRTTHGGPFGASVIERVMASRESRW